jgi:hypothetical protein
MRLAEQTRQFDENLAEQTRQFDENLALQARQFDENLAFLKQKYGDEAGIRMARQISELIGMGFDVNQVNERLGTNLDATQFANLYAATPLGERGYQRDIQMANTLLASGDYKGASSILSQRFPGVPIDFSAMITQQNASFYQQGMEMLAKMVNTPGMDADDAAVALQKAGLLERMGLSTDEAKELFDGMKVNAIDESWKAIENSDAYKQLEEDDPERAEEIRTIWEHTAFGDMELTVMDRYNVYDADGNLVATVAGEVKANEVAAKYGTTPVNTGKKSVVMRSDAETDFNPSDKPETIGDYIGVPKDAKPGDVFIENGIAYKYDPVAGASEVTYNDPFDAMADKLLEIGPESQRYHRMPEENPYYEDIITARAAAYAGGDRPLIPGTLSYDDPVYKRLASMSILKNGVGSKSITKSGVQSTENYYFENLEGLGNGDLFRIGGKVYSYENKKEITRADTGDEKWNPVIYYMVDVVTGDRRAVLAWSDAEEMTMPVDANEVERAIESKSPLW